MVRETRHLWVGNLPDNIRDDRIREHFKRYGRVQNVKLLGRTDNVNTGVGGGGASGVCATVAFMDIKSASKAHNAEHVLDERTLCTEYYEPAAIPSAAGATSAGSSPAGSGYSGSSSSVNSAPAPASVSRYHLSGGEDNTTTTCPLAASAAAPATWRGTNDSATEYCRRGNTPAAYGRYQRNNSSAPYSTPPSNVERTTPHHRWYTSGERAAGATGGESTPSTPGGGTEGGRRRRHSGSGSSRSDSSSPEPSDTSRASTPATQPPLSHHNNHRTQPTLQHQWASTASGRPLAICVRNLPTRSTDSSLKDGLYHEYKKHGKVVWVKVVGQNADRYAVVRFKKPPDVEKALEVSQDKLFFGCKISVAPHQSCDEDADSAKPYETDIDEYHPKATRTLFIGNLEKDVTQQQLRDKFKHFGRIIEIDIKKGSSGGAGYAFCQYASISSVVEAIRAMDGEYVGGSRVKLGFGKPVATTCVWVDGLTEHTEKQVLSAVSRCGGATSVCVDRAAGAALVHFEQAAAAGAAVRELRRVAAAVSAAEPDHPRLCVDYASRECQEAFYEQLEKHGGSAALTGTERLSGDLATRYLPSTRHDSIRYEGCGSRSRGSSYGRGASRTPRYSALEHYDPAEYVADRRYRVYADGGASPATATADEAPYEERLQSVVVSPHRSRHARRDSSADAAARNHSKERHRSGGVRRSRSGSRGGTTERHGARRRHRRRRDGSGSMSRADTPLRDEPDAPPAEPRRPPRERPPLPMSLPLPKFAVQLLRATPATPRIAPAAAPDSPPRPPSVSSSSGGSAPHSPSLEERIRSLDEKLNGSRALNDVPDRARLRHRLLDVDINEVKPSEVVRSLLAKRSVFDEDSERLEGAGRATSPHGSPRGRASAVTPRALRYPFPAHPPPQPLLPPDLDLDAAERPADPRLVRSRPDPCVRPRTPSSDRRSPPSIADPDVGTGNLERRCRDDFTAGAVDDAEEASFTESRIILQTERGEPNARDLGRKESTSSNGSRTEINECIIDKQTSVIIDVAPVTETLVGETDSADSFRMHSVDKSAREVMDMLLKRIENQECQKSEPFQADHQPNKFKDNISKSEVYKEDTKTVIHRDNKGDHLYSMDSQKNNEKIEERVSKELIPYSIDSQKGLESTENPITKDFNKKTMDAQNSRETIEECIKKELDAYSMDCEKHKDPVENHGTNILECYSTEIKQSKESIEDCITKELNSYTMDTKKPKESIDSHISKEFNSHAIYGKKSKQTIDDHISRELIEYEKQHHLNTINSIKLGKDNTEPDREVMKSTEKNIKDRHSHNAYNIKLEKENIQFDKTFERDKNISNTSIDTKNSESERNSESDRRIDRDKTRNCKDRSDKDKHDSEKSKNKHEKNSEKRLKEELTTEKSRADRSERIKVEKDLEKSYQKEKVDKDCDKSRHIDEKSSRYDHHRKERNDKDKRKDSLEIDFASSKNKKDEKHKHDRSKKDNESKRESKKESETTKHRKSSRDESTKDICRKDSTDSSTSRASHESSKIKDTDNIDIKDDIKSKCKPELCFKQEIDKDLPLKIEIKEEKSFMCLPKIKTESVSEHSSKSKADIEKQRHYSLDSPSLESKRKERLNSCSSLPSNIGHKRRISSQDSLDCFNDDVKKLKNDLKTPERRESKDSRTESRHKTTKFSKGHFAKIIESKTKDDKKNQVKPPDDSMSECKESDHKDQKIIDKTKCVNKSPKIDSDEKCNAEFNSEGLHNDLDFLATLELRSSEEDERQKALRKEMKEKKRIQQLQQIQELQMQHDALQQGEGIGKGKDDKKPKLDEKKREAIRDKRMSTDRKSRDEKIDSSKRKSRRPVHTSDSSDSDEPKKHSIFDIIDDCPTYISMYDKVKARSCKNMQKQEEEKRQEKIKAKFSQLKQSRAKREEKKRSSWDEDSDSDHESKKLPKSSLDNSSDDDKGNLVKKLDKSHGFDYDSNNTEEYFGLATNEEDLRNKLSRKNSRTRIMSDTSDDETYKRHNKSPNFLDIKKENLSDSEPIERIGDEDSLKNSNVIHDSIKKNSLLNLFGKSDSDDSKIKMNFDNGYKSNFLKSISHDFSSESESVTNRNCVEIRKKHRKKQKKHKTTYSDDETKINNNSDTSLLEGEHRLRIIDKQRRHSSKKEKRKEKIRESVDTDDLREEKFKLKKEKKIPATNSFESGTETTPTILKKDGKMEDIFGPLSDDSDKGTKHTNHKSDYSSLETDFCTNNTENKLKDREDNKRKRDRKRKEKLLKYFKDDDNSLDVDAVSKAIEARLFADALDSDNHIKIDSQSDINKIHQNDIKCSEENTGSEINKHDRIRKDCREKKKKKKRSKDDRQSRREHHHFYHQEKINNIDYTVLDDGESSSPKTMLLDIPLPNDVQTVKNVEIKDDDGASHLHSLPRLTDSPPVETLSNEISDEKNKDSANINDPDDKMDYIENKEIEIEEIPMPPPFVPDISEVPLPKDPLPSKLNQNKEEFMSSFDNTDNMCENAVRNISNSEKDVDKTPEKTLDVLDIPSSKMEKKAAEEKPRAIISQEETADAVAALLGESFGGKVNTFASCFEEDDNNPTHTNESESVVVENENIPEEDAEEMRQAVQNLNASEMEMKPDTPVSDSDLLLIDTDTEEADETPQDAIDKLPISIIATNPALNNVTEQNKPTEVSNVTTKEIKLNVVTQPVLPERSHSVSKESQTDVKIHLAKRENVQIITSTATPVITSWTLTNNKLVEPHVLNIQNNQLPTRDKNDLKPTHITANIVQIKGPQNMQINNAIRPMVAPTRVSSPYQVINQMIRTQTPNMQPPTIKIPEPHMLYQKQQGIVISPRLSSDPRMQSPKASPQGEGMTSPRLGNMAILNSSPQNLPTVGMASPNAMQQRSPGQVTVVRMQQPPLSPIQTMHMPHGARTMLSPNRPNSVLVQTQGAPIHFNRLPVTPVLAPISKQINVNNLVQQNKTISVPTSPSMHQQKITSGDPRRNETKNISENKNEATKIILSPNSLHTTSASVATQNRLINMQNAMHVGNINSPVHLGNKLLLNAVNHMNEKRDNQGSKSDQMNHIPYASTPIIHVGGANNATTSPIIQTGVKTVTLNLQENIPISRSQGANVIHTLNSQRLLTPAPSNVIHVDVNKGPPSVLSMATIRSPTVLNKLELSSITPATTTSSLSLPPLLLKTTSPTGLLRLNTKVEHDNVESVLQNHLKKESYIKTEDKCDPKVPHIFSENIHRQNDVKPSISPGEQVNKCETDFEELLKDNTNEIKVTNDPENKLEVNVGKTVTLFTTNQGSDKDTNVENKTDHKLLSPVQPVGLSSTFPDLKEKKISTEVSNLEKQNNQKMSEMVNSSKADHKTNDKITHKDGEIPKMENISKTSAFFTFMPSQADVDNHLKNDENDSWSAKDVNIESVIKKVDSLCNDNIDIIPKNEAKDNEFVVSSKLDTRLPENISENLKPIDKAINTHIENITENPKVEEGLIERISTTSKRGGRSVRGKKMGKNQDRVQTRQISKPSRGATSGKRGRGRAKVDKKIKSLVSNTASAMPGDVYDFHEDSGDESASSTNKGEPRPRLILTIKSPLSGHANITATSTLSIASKDKQKPPEKPKDEKSEDTVSPSPNTRKSRRLQEKDVQRSTVDDVIEDVIKGGGRPGKDCAKKRLTKQAIAKTNSSDKGTDTRKSPRGAKRTRDRSMSDASADSGDERFVRRDDGASEAKTPRRDEVTDLAPPDSAPAPMDVAPITAPVVPPVPPPAQVHAPAPPVTYTPTLVLPPAATPTLVAAVAPAPAPPPAPIPTPITKPPKKMISEISAKLACVFEAVSSGPSQQQAEAEVAPPAPREAASPHGQSAAGVAAGADFEALRRLSEAGGAALPVGTEAADARVQSPALPHRPPSAPDHHHRPADRATPLLIRGGEGEGAGVARAFRGYAATASLPRGAHHPPHPPPDHQFAKQAALVGPQAHRHHPGAASRVTLASVPSISPQGQVAMSADLVRSPPPAHQQTSPVTAGDGMYPHFSHQHYQMYQQHFRATQHESRATPSPYTRSLEAEGSVAPTPPLELRRPPSARVPHAPAPELEALDAFRRRAAPVPAYAVGCGRSPPPAHGTSRHAGALPPHATAAAGAAGPPHASQVPREADSLQMLLRRYPVMWQGLLALKNDSAAVQMHFVGGNPNVAADTLTRHADGAAPLLRIAQRMRLEQPQLDQVHRKMKMENEHCMLLALPCGRDHMDVLQQSTNLTAGFITYLQRKQAAGIVNIAPPGHHQAMFTVHIFPSCEFANENLNRIAPDLMHRVADIAHLLIVIATV